MFPFVKLFLGALGRACLNDEFIETGHQKTKDLAGSFLALHAASPIHKRGNC